MANLRTDAAYIVRCKIKSGVTISYGQSLIFTATDDEVDVAGAGALVGAGFALEGGVGTAAGVYIDVALGGPSLPGIASGAIAAGSALITAAGGKVIAGTTAGAIFGNAISNAAADGDRVWVKR